MKAIDLTLLTSVTNNLSHYITKIHLNRTDQTDWTFCTCKEQKKKEIISPKEYRKIPKISPSMYKPPKLVTQKDPPLNSPSKYKLPGACTWKIALK